MILEQRVLHGLEYPPAHLVVSNLRIQRPDLVRHVIIQHAPRCSIFTLLGKWRRVRVVSASDQSEDCSNIKDGTGTLTEHLGGKNELLL
jgi:hypothetical protein